MPNSRVPPPGLCLLAATVTAPAAHAQAIRRISYRQEATGARWVVAVAKRREEAGVLTTAYRTDAVKEGKRIWPV
jgi:hypothetical protein